jgi:hypothetical protein
MRVLIVGLVLGLLAATSTSFLWNREAGSPAEKQQLVWQKIIANTNPGPWPTMLENLKLLFMDMNPTVNAPGDEMPSGRQKLIHPVGAVVGVEFRWQSNPYTGLFKKASFGIARFSLAKECDYGKAPADAPFTPGVGWKFFRDGDTPSGNFVSMRGLTGQNSYNAFKYPFSNHISYKEITGVLKAIKLKFDTVSDWATYSGLSDFASWDEEGNHVDNPNFPWQLIFRPVQARATAIPDQRAIKLYDQVRNITAGSKLYDIEAINEPKGVPFVIGEVYTTTAFTTSLYADTKLFFKHTVFDADLKLKPEWKTVCRNMYECDVCPFDMACPPTRKA